MIEGRNSEEQRLIRALHDHGQEQLLRFWGELTDDERDLLMKDIAGIDLDWVDGVKPLLREGSLSRRVVRKPDVIELPRTSGQNRAMHEARRRGRDMIAAGKTSVFTAAGGQSSRLGLETPKGTYPVSPIRNKSLFQVHAEKIASLERDLEVKIPWLIMVSETNHAATLQYFRDNDYFNLDPDYVRFIEQGMYPAMDADAGIFLREKYRVFLSPTGHGGTLTTLNASKALDWLGELGVQEIFYFQVDNVLVKILDPVFMGYHTGRSCEMSSKYVKKRNHREKIGVFVIEKGFHTVVEYSELSCIDLEGGGDVNELTAGSVAIHIINVDFARRAGGKSLQLPLHVAHKAIPHIDEAGNAVKPEHPNGYKFETFIFDALKFVSNSVVMETDRSEEFSPLKNRCGDDSPETVLRDQLELFASWLEEAGIEVPRNERGEMVHRIEISPLFAASREEFLDKVDRNLKVKGDIYIE
jgi:UDP-N-acetylglucosamine/UDP-N-acetylgalactosamine diphosphorylase